MISQIQLSYRLPQEINESVNNLQKVGKIQRGGILNKRGDGSLLRSGEVQLECLSSGQSWRTSVGGRLPAGLSPGYLFLFENTLLVCLTKMEADGINKSYTFIDGFPIETFEAKVLKENKIEVSKRESGETLSIGLVFENNKTMLQWMQRFMRVLQTYRTMINAIMNPGGAR